MRAFFLGSLTLVASCSSAGDRPSPARPAPAPASSEHRAEPRASVDDDFPSEGRPVPGPITDPLGFVMPARTSWTLVRNDAGPERFALHDVPVPVRTYTYVTTVDRVEIGATVVVFWFRAAPIADGRELAARLERTWVRDVPSQDGSWMTELRRGSRPQWAFATPSTDGSTAVVLCGDQPPEAVGYVLEEEGGEPTEEEYDRALARVEDPARDICASIRRTEPRPAMLPEHDSTPL